MSPSHINKLSELLRRIRLCDAPFGGVKTSVDEDPLQVNRAEEKIADEDPPLR